MAHDVFISYASTNRTVAQALCADLESRGIRCWVAPRDVLPGREYGEQIISALNASKVFLLVFSAASNQSPQVRREVERAVSKGLPILPLRIEDVLPSESLEYCLSATHWLDALSTPLQQHFHKIGEAVGMLLQLEQPATSLQSTIQDIVVEIPDTVDVDGKIIDLREYETLEVYSFRDVEDPVSIGTSLCYLGGGGTVVGVPSPYSGVVKCVHVVEDQKVGIGDPIVTLSVKIDGN